METWSRHSLWIVAVLTVVLLLVRTRDVPLIDPDEPRFARTSQEMLRSGDLVVPSFEWTPRLVKPPLFHWVQATVFRLIGASELSARLPSVLSTLGSLLILGWVVRRRFGDEGAMWAAIFFATMPLVAAGGRLGTVDALLSVHVMAALALDLAEPEEVGAHRQGAIGALLGLAFLVKGPVGVAAPVLVMVAGRAAAGRSVLPGRRPLLAFVAAFAVVVLPWTIAFVARVGASAAVDLLRDEIFARAVEGTAHVEPSWYYLPIGLLSFLPWAGPLALALVRVLGQRNEPGARTALYAAAGLLAGLVFFSLSRGKLPSYILPLAPLVAILVTWELGQELDAPRERTVGPTLLAASLAAFGLVLVFAAGRYPQEVAQRFALASAAIYLAGSVVAFVGVLRYRPRHVYGVAALTQCGFLVLAVTVLLPGLMQSRSSRELIAQVPELAGRRPLVVVQMRVPSLVFYLDRIPERITAAEVEERMRRGDDPLFVVDPDDLDLFPPATLSRLAEVGRQGKYRVYEFSAAAREPDAPDPGEAELDDAPATR